MSEPALLTIEEVSEYLGVPRQLLYSWRHEGKGPAAIQLEGRLLRYRQADLDAWLEAQARTAAPPRTAAASTPA